MGKVRKVATFKERMGIAELLKANTQEVNGNPNLRRWNEGWSFSRVAESVHDHLNDHHSRYVAREMGWDFEAPPQLATSTVYGQLKARVDDIEKNVLKLMEQDEQAAALGEREMQDIRMRLTRVENVTAKSAMMVMTQESPERGTRITFKSWIVYLREGQVSKPTEEFVKWFAFHAAAKDQINSLHDLKRFVAAQKLNRNAHGQRVTQAEIAWNEYNSQTNGE